MNFTKENLGLLACPLCKKELNIDIIKAHNDEIISGGLNCNSCRESFEIIEGIPHLIPRIFLKNKKYKEWEEKQRLGLKDYKNPNEDYQRLIKLTSEMFGAFCQHRGNVLDIGCGISPRLNYFKKEFYRDVNFTGVDPLIGHLERDYLFVQGMGEHLPFLNGTMDQVVISTTLDHLINPLTVLKEAERVLKKGGNINIWIGIFSPLRQRRIDLIKRAIHLIQKGNLKRLAGGIKKNIAKESLLNAGDKYHFNRFTDEQVTSLFNKLEMKISRRILLDEGDKYLFLKVEK